MRERHIIEDLITNLNALTLDVLGLEKYLKGSDFEHSDKGLDLLSKIDRLYNTCSPSVQGVVASSSTEEVEEYVKNTLELRTRWYIMLLERSARK